MTRAVWDHLLGQVEAAFADHPDLRRFCDFPDDVTAQAVDQRLLPCAGYMTADGMDAGALGPLCDAFLAAGAHAHWRDTYVGTDIGDDFMERFGCYALIGSGGAFDSAKMWAWVVHMPPHLHYPWHHHPAEELYLVLGGEAAFMRAGQKTETLRPGDTCFHASNQPHAMETGVSPVMALVVWRNGFETPPVLTEGEVT